MVKTYGLFGPPGAGKGTRWTEYSSVAKISYNNVSVGNLLRKNVAAGTPLGKEAKSYMDSGALVPDDIINGLVIDEIKNSSAPVVLDGFPRTVGQAQAMLDAGIIPVVVYFYVDDEIVLKRAANRLVCKCGETYTTDSFKPPVVEGICDKCGSTLGRRSDDAPEVVKNRLEVYRRETLPVLDLFRQQNVTVYEIDNSNSAEARKQFAEIMSNN